VRGPDAPAGDGRGLVRLHVEGDAGQRHLA